VAGAQRRSPNTWTEDEVLALVEAHALHGNMWTKIVNSVEFGPRLHGRNAIQCGSKWRDMEAARASEVSRSINHTLPPPLNAPSPAPSAVST